MPSIGQQKIEPIPLVVMAALVAAVTVVAILAPATMPWGFAALAGGLMLVYWVARWDVLILTWIWVGSYGVLDWGDAVKIPIAGFFTLNPCRIIFLVAIVGYFLYFVFHRGGFRVDRKVFWFALAFVLYLGVNAHLAGWTSSVKDYSSAPYYRYIGGILLPFTMLFLAYNVIRSEKQAMWPFLLASVYGWYALYLGYLQYAWTGGAEWARYLIWPSHLTDSDFGIHSERGRGAFQAAGAQALFLVTLFFMNLYSIRRLKGRYRPILMLQTVMIPPAIFFTGIRAGYVAFLLCGFFWCLMGARYRAGRLKLAVVTVILLIGVLAFWESLSGTDRRSGGVAQMSPVRSRQILAAQSWETFKTHPITGVGFGHWIDHQVQMERDPAEMAGMPLGMLTQHNVFLMLLTETGIVGLIGFICVLVGVLVNTVQLYRRLPSTAQGWLSREYVVVFWIIMLNYLVSGMFRDVIWEIAGSSLLWSMAGLLLGFHGQLEPQRLELPEAANVWA